MRDESKHKTVKFSIALCTYQGARYLPAQLDSIAAQTLLPDELIICDDCSTDETRDVITSFAARAPFAVRLYVNEVNLGSTRNFEQAISLCTGDIITLSDQDDVWLPAKLERIHAIFSTAPEVGMVFTDAELVDENLSPCGAYLWQYMCMAREHRLFREGKAFEALVRRNVVTGATMAFRAPFRELVLPIPSNHFLIHDGWIALLIAAVADVVALPEPLIKYRQHPQQQIGVVRRRNELEADVSRENSWAKRETYYQSEIKKLDDIRDRLLTDNDDLNRIQVYSITPARIAYLEELAAHYRVRGGIPKHRRRRVPVVLRELRMGRYSRFSKGLISAVKDILR